jgi:hypothetical protein
VGWAGGAEAWNATGPVEVSSLVTNRVGVRGTCRGISSWAIGRAGFVGYIPRTGRGRSRGRAIGNWNGGPRWLPRGSQ